jgi:thioredoxin-like negative regulator of GroEL
MKLPLRLAVATLIGLAAVGLAGAPAHAATEAPFTQAAFEAAEQAGKQILVHIEAPWCPTCAKQRPVIAKLAAEPAYADLIIYKVDFDHQKDVVRNFGAQMQSTLIAFHGKTEEARSTGDTDPASITALVAKTKG